MNTPRLVADSTGTTVWRWDQAEPFGANPASDDPDGNSVAFDLPLRLPGQRYDQETGLHYNYFRDYDPGLGRYAQSDPIGLDGGLNAYLYVVASPLVWDDPEGKQGRYTRDCGRCKVIYDSDQWKGAHTHWICPGQPQGCITKTGELCDGSAPPPPEVRECLENWGRIPKPVKKEMCGPTCKTVITGIVIGGLVVGGFCLAGPAGSAFGGVAGTSIMLAQ